MPTKEQYAKDREKYRAYGKRHYEAHAEEYKARWGRYRKANPDRVREARLKFYFGLSAADYDVMLAKQDGHCAICPAVSDGKRRLAVDHDHKTGRVRGLLCGRCNKALGLFDETVTRIEAAARYLENQ